MKAMWDGFSVIHTNQINRKDYISRTLAADVTPNQIEAQVAIHKILRRGESVTQESASGLFHNLFFNPDRYDLSATGRRKLNAKFGRVQDGEPCILYDAQYITTHIGYEEKEINAEELEDS